MMCYIFIHVSIPLHYVFCVRHPAFLFFLIVPISLTKKLIEVRDSIKDWYEVPGLKDEIFHANITLANSTVIALDSGKL